MVSNESLLGNHATPSSGTEGGKSTALQEFVALHPSICFVRCQWQDHSGVVRARVVPIEHALSLAANKRTLHVPPCAFQLTVTNDSIPEIDPRGNHRLIPDWSSLRTRPTFDSSYASVMCRVVEHLPSRPEPNWNFCPRRALVTVVEKAEKLLQAEFLVGFEVEFQVMKLSADGSMVPFSRGIGRCAISGQRDPCFAYVEEVVRVLQAAGVGVGAFQTEGDRGQYEIALEPQTAMSAIDELIFVHDTIKSVFARHGLVATMAPRPVESRSQTAGQHMHVSINPPNRESSFLAGILGRLPELCALCLPYDLSYERVQPYLAGHVVAWGSENRAVPIRQIKSGHWEFRCMDATANVYLALAAVLSAGMMGCVREEPLQWPDTGFIEEHYPVNGTPLPRTIEESLERLQDTCHDFQSVMESQVIRHYISVKRAEAPKLQSMAPVAVRHLLTEIF